MTDRELVSTHDVTSVGPAPRGLLYAAGAAFRVESVPYRAFRRAYDHERTRLSTGAFLRRRLRSEFDAGRLMAKRGRIWDVKSAAKGYERW